MGSNWREARRESIRRMLADGDLTDDDIAEALDVSVGLVRAVAEGRATEIRTVASYVCSGCGLRVTCEPCAICLARAERVPPARPDLGIRDEEAPGPKELAERAGDIPRDLPPHPVRYRPHRLTREQLEARLGLRDRTIVAMLRRAFRQYGNQADTDVGRIASWMTEATAAMMDEVFWHEKPPDARGVTTPAQPHSQP